MQSTNSTNTVLTMSPTNKSHIIPAIKRRWLPATLVFATCGLVSASMLSRRQPLYLAEAQLQFQSNAATPSLTEISKELGKVKPSSNRSSLLSTEIEFLRSVKLVQQTIDQLNLTDEDGQPLKRQAFLNNLSVNEVRGTDTLKISYQDPDAERSAKIINKLIELYIADEISRTQSRIRSVREFVQEQLPTTAATVKATETKLRQFKERNRVISLADDRMTTIDGLKDIQQRISNTQAELLDLGTQASALRSQLGSNSRSALLMTEISQNTGVQTVLSDIQKLEGQIATGTKQYQDGHPKLQRLRQEQASLQRILQQRLSRSTGRTTFPTQNLQGGKLRQELTRELVAIENRWRGLGQKLNGLLTERTKQQQRAAKLPSLEQTQRELNNQLDAAQSTYARLLKKDSELRIAEQEQLGRARILSPALEPDTPVTSLAPYLSATLLGLLLAGGTIFGLELGDRTIKTAAQAKQQFGATLLGIVPWSGKIKYGLTGMRTVGHGIPKVTQPFDAMSLQGAAYRMIQSNLKFASPDQHLNTIVITSSVPQEGKSIVTANLAMAFAAASKRVLIIDAHLNHPVQHRIWAMSNDSGLSNLLAETLSPRTLINTVQDRVDVLSAGDLPPNSLAILDSQKMLALIDQLSAQYDMILIDTPALRCGNEALVLGKVADGILFVSRPGIVTSECIEAAKERLIQSEQQILGQVINGVIETQASYEYRDDPDRDRLMTRST